CLTSGSAQVYPVGALLGELHGVQSCGHVGSGIACPGDLVHQLGGDGAWGHRTPAAWVFGDGRAAVGVDLGDREPGVGQVVAVVCQFFGVGVVAAGGLGSAFDDMAGHGGPGQCVEVLPFPSEVGDGGSQGQGGVGDPAGDDDVGTCVQAGGDTEGAQVGVGGQWCAEVEFLGPVEEIVAGDAGDAGGKAELVGQFGEFVGQSTRVEASGVAHHGDPAFHDRGQIFPHLPQEGLGVAAFGVGELVSAEDGHGQFGQVVTGEDIDGTFGEHLLDGGEA